MQISRMEFLKLAAGMFLAPDLIRGLPCTGSDINAQTQFPVEQGNSLVPIAYTVSPHGIPLSVKELTPELESAVGKGPVVMRLRENSRIKWDTLDPQFDLVLGKISSVQYEYPNDPNPGLRINVQWESIQDPKKDDELAKAFAKVDFKSENGIGVRPLRNIHDIDNNYPTLGPAGSHSVVSIARFG